MSTDYLYGDDSMVPIYMWYRRAWTDQDVVVSDALIIIWEGMLRWRRCKLMRYFCRVLRWSSSLWRSVSTSRGVKELDRTYVWVGKEWEKYI